MATGNPADTTSPKLILDIIAPIRKLFDAFLLGRMTGLTGLDVLVEVGGGGILRVSSDNLKRMPTKW